MFYTFDSDDSQASETSFFNNVSIPGLNIKDGIARLGNDEESYIQVLRSYIIHIPEFMEIIKNELSGNIREYQIAVHGIKGSCRVIGAEELGNMAEELELAANKENIDFLQDKTGAFLASIEDFRTRLSGFIRSIDEQSKIVKPENEELNQELLKQIIDSCNRCDIDALKTAIKSLDANTYKSAPGLGQWLQEQADKSNFNEIIKKLTEDYIKI